MQLNKESITFFRTFVSYNKVEQYTNMPPYILAEIYFDSRAFILMFSIW